MAEKIEVFLCYAREDEDLRLKLEKQLGAMKRQGMIDIWHDRNISAGAEWEKEVDRHLDTAQVVLLLISPDFIASDYCFSVELKRTMERFACGEILVIPIILRPVDWQGSLFGKLQALPKDARPVTTWSNPDEALFNIAEGIRRAIGELIVRWQARTIALFEYEMRDGRASPLWVNPSAFLLDKAYQSWMDTKRDFSSSELVGQTWVKTSNPEHTFIVHFFSGGAFREYALSDPENQWQGSWELLHGILRMKVHKYELDIFANRESSVHSGIEYAQDGKEPHSCFVCFPLSDVQTRHWDINAVPELIEQLFDRVLHQRIDAKLLITYGPLLCRGEMSIRSVVKILGVSRRFKEYFIDLKRSDETIEFLYTTFLGREADATGKLYSKKEFQTRGSNVVIADLIDSEEYQRNFGEDTLPPGNPHFKLAHMLKQMKLS